MTFEALYELRRQVQADNAGLVRLRAQQIADLPALLDEFAAFARSRDASVELRALQRRVDRGEFTWDQAVLGGPGAVEVDWLLAPALVGLPDLVRRAADPAEAEPPPDPVPRDATPPQATPPPDPVPRDATPAGAGTEEERA